MRSASRVSPQSLEGELAGPYSTNALVQSKVRLAEMTSDQGDVSW